MRNICLLTFALIFTSCAHNNYELQSACECKDPTTYVVKWDVSPLYDGKVRIYTSDSPDSFDLRKPLTSADALNGFSEIKFSESCYPRYFMLDFDNGMTSVAGIRAPKVSGVTNIRDLGGYLNSEKRSIKWGCLYRSGNLDTIKMAGVEKLRQLKIKTFIDFRMDVEKQFASRHHCIENYYSYPIETLLTDPYPMVYKHKFKTQDASVFMQNVFRRMVVTSADSYKNAFKLLSEKGNYPIAFGCKYGLVQSSFFTVLLLTALDVPEQVIMDEYLLNNQYFSVRILAPNALQLPEECQNAIITMAISDEKYLNAAINLIKSDYGSIGAYLEKEFGIDEQYKCKLKALLLDK